MAATWDGRSNVNKWPQSGYKSGTWLQFLPQLPCLGEQRVGLGGADGQRRLRHLRQHLPNVLGWHGIKTGFPLTWINQLERAVFRLSSSRVDIIPQGFVRKPIKDSFAPEAVKGNLSAGPTFAPFAGIVHDFTEQNVIGIFGNFLQNVWGQHDRLNQN